MSRRFYNKRLARRTADLRQQLVHAAGCVFETCSNFHAIANGDALEAADVRPVSVPRSFRSLFGRWVGGAR